MKATITSFNPKTNRDMNLLLAIAENKREKLSIRLLALQARIKAHKLSTEKLKHDSTN